MHSFRVIINLLIVAVITISINGFAPVAHHLPRAFHTNKLSMKTEFNFDTKYFDKTAVDMAGTTEYVVKGGVALYPKVAEVFKARGIHKIGVIGWVSFFPRYHSTQRMLHLNWLTFIQMYSLF